MSFFSTQRLFIAAETLIHTPTESFYLKITKQQIVSLISQETEKGKRLGGVRG